MNLKDLLKPYSMFSLWRSEAEPMLLSEMKDVHDYSVTSIKLRIKKASSMSESTQWIAGGPRFAWFTLSTSLALHEDI